MDNKPVFNEDSLKKLFPIVKDFFEKKKAGEDIDLTETAKAVAAALGINDIKQYVEVKLADGLSGLFDEETAKEVATIAAAMAMPAGKAMMQFVEMGKAKDLNKESAKLLDTFDKLLSDYSDALQSAIQSGLGFDLPPEALSIAEKFSLGTLSVYCFAAAFGIYQKAAEDASAAKDLRIEYEQHRDAAMAELISRRAKLQEFVDSYLGSYLSPFAAGIAAMDEAVFAGDDDGYIRANAQLQELFGYKAQYQTAQEFDDLMLSDETFRL